MTLCICKKDIHLGPDHLLLLSRTYLQTINIIEQITKKNPKYNVEYEKSKHELRIFATQKSRLFNSFFFHNVDFTTSIKKREQMIRALYNMHVKFP